MSENLFTLLIALFAILLAIMVGFILNVFLGDSELLNIIFGSVVAVNIFLIIAVIVIIILKRE